MKDFKLIFWLEESVFDMQLEGSITWKGLSITKILQNSCCHSFHNEAPKLSKDGAGKE